MAVVSPEGEEAEILSVDREVLPTHVQDTITHLEGNGFTKAPEGYRGGREFENRPLNGIKQLPVKDEGYYREWDTKPNSANRGTERLVTGQEGEIYYTNTHYGQSGAPSFLKVNNKSN